LEESVENMSKLDLLH